MTYPCILIEDSRLPLVTCPRILVFYLDPSYHSTSTALVRCLEPRNVCHSIATRATPKRQMKETLYTRQQNTVELMMVEKDRKAALHTDAVNRAVKSHERNVVLDGRPPPISNSEKDLTRKDAQLRSGYRGPLDSYKSTAIQPLSKRRDMRIMIQAKRYKCSPTQPVKTKIHGITKTGSISIF